MVLIRESSDFVGKKVKINTIQSSEIGKLIIIEENGILLLRDDGIHVYYNSHNIISIEYVPPMGTISSSQKKLQEEKEKDDFLKNVDRDRVKLLIRADKIKDIIDDSDYEIEINIDKIEIDSGDTAEIVEDKIIVYDEDFILTAKEIANEFDLTIDREYEEE